MCNLNFKITVPSINFLLLYFDSHLCSNQKNNLICPGAHEPPKCGERESRTLGSDVAV